MSPSAMAFIDAKFLKRDGNEGMVRNGFHNFRKSFKGQTLNDYPIGNTQEWQTISAD